MDVDTKLGQGHAEFEQEAKFERNIKVKENVRSERDVRFQENDKSEQDVKFEDGKFEQDHILDGSPSQSPTLDVPQKTRLSPTPTPPPQSAHDGESTNGTTSKASTPPIKQPRKSPSNVPQLIGDLAVARQDALATFNEISDNNYQYKTLGRSRELLESMSCDCTYEHGVDSEDMACGPYSDCINRLTQVECLPGDCRCRNYCQNQRFQQKEYANIEIVLTEKKGYGLRAEEDLPKDSFVYEYVGDVVNPVSFKKRMREYAQEGIQHFYFMMLQKDEFIDATKSGGIGRFANHSCNPNCYVAKWTVGEKVRMGIFSKRLVRKHEELTFNYNVDRYGHQAQPCYCGEPNCVGYIGGKTQTEFAAMDDLYLDALGITDEDELMELKGTKKRKGKKIDDPDFMPTLKPVVEKDIPKVVQAVRQTTSRKMLYKVLTRIRITEDQAALRQLMRLRGYSIMTNVLNDYKEDMDLVFLALECMEKWPLMNKNKVEDSQVWLPVEEFTKLEDEKVKILAQKLLDHWNTLPTYNRIPKRLITVQINDGPPKPTYDDGEDEFSRREQELKRARMEEEEIALQRLKVRVRAAKQKEFDEAQRNNSNKPSPSAYALDPKEHHRKQLEEQQKIQAIITSVAEATARKEAAAAAEAEERKAKQELAATNAAKKKDKDKDKKDKEKRDKDKEKDRRHKKLTPEEKAAKEASKEKRLLKLVGAVVVKSMSKYAKALGKEEFKKYAKELTHLIADKEKKSASYKENRLEALSEEKVTKIKKFCKEYIVKLLRKLNKSGKSHRHGSSSHKSNGHGHHPTASTSIVTPSSVDGGHGDLDFDGDGDGMEMSVEEAMDMEADDDVDYNEEDTYDAGDGDDYGDDHGDEKTKSSPASASAPTPSTSKKGSAHPQGLVGVDHDDDDAWMAPWPSGGWPQDPPESKGYNFKSDWS
ncbi:hypothetical protein P691DRAFT_663480 [Macrolepiota fuliginosa MF-IS2]|uniref:Histone-lysine N-methyltransferase, H3 lysine-36 specific n=1 Tax=Macrolepiota fuliginosa MF-IS2 TaxID=1400762 RepID=A0A9P5XI56_9AGAR|nr:hypothetical protein P691DRAFT_663480 [Macrolepiota fuliginosa MF-IS2]